jgi:hypothetical protein
MVRIQKLTRQRYTFAPHCGDLVLEANAKGDDALENEDVSVIGPWSDSMPGKATASGGPQSKAQQQWGGHVNELFGTVAWIESHEDLDNLTAIGTSADVHRRRKKFFYKKLDGRDKH